MTIGQQTSTYTQRGLYTELMDDVASVVQGRGVTPRRILSYGCSTGAECLDLAQAMNKAAIYGCDLNLKALAAARQTCDGVATIIHSNADELGEAGPFDAIFALNVFCRHPQAAGLDNVSRVYAFSAFERGIADVDAHVAPGGVLALYNGQYFFEDTAASRSYRPYADGSYDHNGWIEKALPSGRRITDCSFSFEGRTYDRTERSRFFKDPDIQPRLLANPGGLRYWHHWLDPAEAEGRSTRHAVWIKNS